MPESMLRSELALAALPPRNPATAEVLTTPPLSGRCPFFDAADEGFCFADEPTELDAPFEDISELSVGALDGRFRPLEVPNAAMAVAAFLLLPQPIQIFFSYSASPKTDDIYIVTRRRVFLPSVQ